MKIVYINEFFSEKMGYSENCLPKAMASLGLEVHVISSDLQVYGNLLSYEDIYSGFLGPSIQPCGSKLIDGFILHRLKHKLWFEYVDIVGLILKIGEISPDIVHYMSCFTTNALKIIYAKNISYLQNAINICLLLNLIYGISVHCFQGGFYILLREQSLADSLVYTQRSVFLLHLIVKKLRSDFMVYKNQNAR